MIQTVSFSMFFDNFQSIRPDIFSYDGLRVLFDYLEELDEELDEDYELDVIGLCGDYTEYTLEEFQDDYGDDYETIEHVQEEFTAIPINGTDSFIVCV